MARYRAGVNWHGPKSSERKRTGNAVLGDLKSKLRTLPTSVAIKVAIEAAGYLTRVSREAYDANKNVYGEARPTGVQGKRLTLRETDATRKAVEFVRYGTVVKCKLPTRYAKYLVGKYGILPNGFMPASWSAELKRLASVATSAELAR
jgi:hypothetical protein